MPSPDQPTPHAKRKPMQGPKGTRDFYPEDLLRRRYIEKAWRDTSIRHGFEEIEGPTFETAELYKVKSGEGILGEMFGVFSGKAEEDLKQLRETGEAPLALRPEFTPTLARMYAARAAQLPKPTKWFTAGPYFRAERPQRGRLREFCQWNVDVIGIDGRAIESAASAPKPERGAEALAKRLREDMVSGRTNPHPPSAAEILNDAYAGVEAECLGCCIGAISRLGLTPTDSILRMNVRLLHEWTLSLVDNIPKDRLDQVLLTFDAITKLPTREAVAALENAGLTTERAQWWLDFFQRSRQHPLNFCKNFYAIADSLKADPSEFGPTARAFANNQLEEWCFFDASITRGLAYYTGLVFELTAGSERAIAGGGRYDNLIELFGGPPTPAVGFGMGDVVLGNLLQDKGLMPEGPALLEALSAPAAKLRPDVFVISNGSEEADTQVRPLVARLRRGQESEAWVARENRKPWDKDRFGAATESRGTPPLHARHSYKATRNIGKLLEDARKSHARFAAIIENAEECSLKNLDTGEQRERVKLTELAALVA